MAYIISLDACIGCGSCEAECPVNAITANEEGKYVMTKLAAKMAPDAIAAVYTHLLKGVGLPSSSITITKKNILEFFNHLSNNPDDIKKVFTYYNKCYRNEYDHGEYDSKPFNKILKY